MYLPSLAPAQLQPAKDLLPCPGLALEGKQLSTSSLELMLLLKAWCIDCKGNEDSLPCFSYPQFLNATQIIIYFLEGSFDASAPHKIQVNEMHTNSVNLIYNQIKIR
ncbi:hypothetical protein Pelo_5 [Pelomyxa schiedti]|nr:hypothetical protein Pelo_5 [Pelomyxa schiedti]